MNALFIMTTSAQFFLTNDHICSWASGELQVILQFKVQIVESQVFKFCKWWKNSMIQKKYNKLSKHECLRYR